MMFAELLPKTNAPAGEEGGLFFCSTEKGVRKIAENRPAGKLLFVTDGSALGAFRTFLPSRALCLVLDSDDCLPLFATSDDVSSVVAAGGRGTLTAARFFAEVRKIPCAVFPACAALDGAYEKSGEVQTERFRKKVPLAEAAVYCDEALAESTAGQAYMRLLLTRLALVEARAMRRFGLSAGREETEERVYGALLPLVTKSLSFREVVEINAVVRKCESEGMSEGEGVALARLIGMKGEEQAFGLLSALYLAFFSKGKPRLTVPDYATRAKRAETPYSALSIHTPEEFAFRAASFEKMRTSFYREIKAILSGELHYRNNFYALTGRAPTTAKSLNELQLLPEKKTGLCSVIRDFGLMEWAERVG